MKLRKSRHCVDYRNVFMMGRTVEISVLYDVHEVSPIEFLNQKRMMVEHWKMGHRNYSIRFDDGYEILGIPHEV